MSEHSHQVALISWWAYAHKQYGLPERALMAIPNGGQRHIAVASKLKAEGVRPGVSDLCLPVARNGFNALWVEMKYGKGKLSTEQVEFKQWQEKEGAKCVTCWDWETAKGEIENYLTGNQA